MIKIVIIAPMSEIELKISATAPNTMKMSIITINHIIYLKLPIWDNFFNYFLIFKC